MTMRGYPCEAGITCATQGYELLLRRLRGRGDRLGSVFESEPKLKLVAALIGANGRVADDVVKATLHDAVGDVGLSLIGPIAETAAGGCVGGRASQRVDEDVDGALCERLLAVSPGEDPFGGA